MQTQEAFGWAARDPSGFLSPFHLTRRFNGENDITIKILYCGICRTDLDMVKNESGVTLYPVVPGHEIVGVVTQVGINVVKFRVGDRAGVGCMVGSCGSCESCSNSLENYCPEMVSTVTMSMFHVEGTMVNQGGFSDKIVVDQHFAVRFPEELPLAGGAPLLCAGITVYSPMRYFGLDREGMHLGVVGLGGLGHLALKFAKAFGIKVTVISTSPAKMNEAIGLLKADSFIVSHDSHQIQGAMDGIIDTVSSPHPLMALVDLLKPGGKLILLGAPDVNKPVELPVRPLLKRKVIGGSMAGGMKETQEMIDFAAKHRITAQTEVIAMDYVNIAMDRLARGDVRYRFVIDIANTLNT